MNSTARRKNVFASATNPARAPFPRWFVLAAAAVGTLLRPLPAAGDVVAAIATVSPERCPELPTLEQLVKCVRAHMPRAGSYQYVVPSERERAAFAGIVRTMLAGACPTSVPALLRNYRSVRVVDRHDGRPYCVLAEVKDANRDGVVDKGWGTFIVALHPQRPRLHHAAPHPLHDDGTDLEAVTLFKRTGSRSFLLCGAHRHANGTCGGSCSADHGSADCAHQTDTMFHAAVETLAHPPHQLDVHIQWHNNRSCQPLDVYASQGLSQTPPAESLVWRLQAALARHQPQLTFAAPGRQSRCNLNGAKNVQGRLLNGAPSVCRTPARAPASERFLHLEQSRAATRATLWQAALEEVWP